MATKTKGAPAKPAPDMVGRLMRQICMRPYVDHVRLALHPGHGFLAHAMPDTQYVTAKARDELQKQIADGKPAPTLSQFGDMLERHGKNALAYGQGHTTVAALEALLAKMPGAAS
jgi:hypothetical protein